MNDERRNYVMVGGFVVLVVVLFVGWVSMISGRSVASDAFDAYYQRVTGLKMGSQVLFQGHRIGFVDQIEFEPSKRIFRVGLELERGWPIPDDSLARIKASGLLSAVVIDIQGGVSSRNLTAGATIASEEPSDLFGALASAAKQMQSLMNDEIQPLLAAIRSDVPSIMDSTQRLMDQTNETVRRINAVLDEENSGRLDRIVANIEDSSRGVSTLVSDVQETRDELHEAIATANSVVQARQGDLDRSLVDLQRSLEAVALHIDAITTSLESASRDAAAFSNQLRRDPSVVLRGRSKADDTPEAP